MAKIINTSKLDLASLNADETHWTYNGLDACITAEIFDNLYPQVDETTRRTYEFSKALQAPVAEMCLRGILVNQQRRRRVLTEMRNKLAILEAQFQRIVSEAIGVQYINWRSPAQLNNFLYNVMNLPVQKKRKADGSYGPSADRDALEKLSMYFIAEPICNHLMALRDLGKSIGFLETEIDPDGRMRSDLKIAGTVTGRFASSVTEFGSGTNLQNVTESLRSVFVADPGYKLANLDLEQGDSRNVGAICWNLLIDHPDWDDRTAGAYLDACESGDLHTTVAKMTLSHLPWGFAPDREIAETICYRHFDYRFMCKKLGHGCLTVDHEVLTKQGWVKIADKPAEILTWSETGSNFQEVLNWTDKQYTGNLHRFAGNSQDLLMTADHRVPFYKDQKKPILYVRSAEHGPATFMPLGGGYKGGPEIVEAKLIAAVMCDGHLETNGVAFHFVKSRKIERLIQHCREYKIPYQIYSDGVTTKIRVKKRFPKNPGPFMFNWTAICLKQFIDELKYWDGHQSLFYVSLFSSKRENLEWYQTFARILGKGGNIQKPQISGFGTTMYRLQQNNRQYANGKCSTHEIISVENVRVLCPTVKSTFFYVRRNGKICVTGNSNYLGQPATMAKHTKFPIQQVKDFQQSYFSAFPCIPAWHTSVFHNLIHLSFIETLFGDRRFFFGRPKEGSTQRDAVAHAPQSMTAKEINTGILNLWRANRVQLLMQVHDSILFQYPEEQEDEIIPWALEQLKVPLVLKRDREFHVPVEAKTGWNWGNRTNWTKDDFLKGLCKESDIGTCKDNPDGLQKYKGHDPRKRQETDFKLKLSLL